MAWIKKIEPEAAEGALKQEYDAAVERAGRVYQILQVQSLNPRTLHASIGFYSAAMHGPSGLTRVEREFLATVVSRANDCFY